MFSYNMFVVKLKLFGPCMTFLHYFVEIVLHPRWVIISKNGELALSVFWGLVQLSYYKESDPLVMWREKHREIYKREFGEVLTSKMWEEEQIVKKRAEEMEQLPNNVVSFKKK